MLSREAILAANDMKTTKVNVPEWGGDVCVRAMSGVERDAFEAEMVEAGNGKRLANLRGRLAARSICDDKGTRLFTDEQANELGDKSVAALDRIIKVVQSVNALDDKGVKRLGEDSTDTPSAVSGSV